MMLQSTITNTTACSRISVATHQIRAKTHRHMAKDLQFEADPETQSAHFECLCKREATTKLLKSTNTLTPL